MGKLPKELPIGTVVLEPISGAFGRVVANRVTVRQDGKTHRSVQVRLDISTKAVKPLIWFALRRIRVAGPYAVVMPTCWFHTAGSPKQALRQARELNRVTRHLVDVPAINATFAAPLAGVTPMPVTTERAA